MQGTKMLYTLYPTQLRCWAEPAMVIHFLPASSQGGNGSSNENVAKHGYTAG